MEVKKLDAKFFDYLEHILSKLNQGSDDKEVTSLINEIASAKLKYLSPEVKIGLWGVTSSGKSTLINVLLGESVLPVNIQETTARATYIKYGKQKKIIVSNEAKNVTVEFDHDFETSLILFANIRSWEDVASGWKKETAQEQLELKIKEIDEKFAQFGDAHEVRQGISRVELEHPSDFLKDNIQLVDLPGLRGDGDNQFEASVHIKNCDVVLFVRNFSRPVDSKEKELIDEVRAGKENLVSFAVVTRIDDYYKKRSGVPQEEVFKEIQYLVKTDLAEYNFSEIYYVSPLMIEQYIHDNFDNAVTIRNLQRKYRAKFRFLRPEIDVDSMAGYTSFFDKVRSAIIEKRELIKEEQAKSVFEYCSDTAKQKVKYYLTKNQERRKLSNDEYRRCFSDLEIIRGEYSKLENMESFFSTIFESKKEIFRKIYKESVFLGLEKLDITTSYKSLSHVEDVIKKNIGISFEQALKSSSDVRNIIQEVYNKYDTQAEKIRKMLIDLNGQLNATLSSSQVNPCGSIDQGELDVNLTFPALGAIGGGVGGALLFEGALGGLFGFGAGLVAIPIFKCLMEGNTDPLAEFGDQVGFIFGSIFGDQERKDACEARMLIRGLNTREKREHRASIILEETGQGVANGVVIEMNKGIMKTINDLKIKERIRQTIDEQADLIESNYKSKLREFSERESELKRIESIYEDFERELSHYTDFPAQNKKAA